MRKYLILLLCGTLSACGFLSGPKTRLVPQAYMPDPPSILMQAPKELQSIKQEPKPTSSPQKEP